MEPQPRAISDDVRPWDRPLVVVPVLVLVSSVGGLFPSFSVSGNLYVLAVGGTFMWMGLAGVAGRRPAPRRIPRAGMLWLIPAALLAVVEAITFGLRDAENFPTLSLIMDPLLEDYLARSAVYFAWLTAFWGLIRR